MWDFILNPFVTVLTFFYSILNHDVVLAIIVATILTRLLTWPLTIQQTRSQRAMQEVQPKLKKLQEKHKNDREKLASEQMALYKEHGVNPFGGCIPLIIQFPILIAFYQAIIHSLAATPIQLIDMAGRIMIPSLEHLLPLNNIWLGMDLTKSPSENPVFAYALPVIVVVTSYLQSKLMTPPTPKSDDEDEKPNQAAAMTQSMTTVMPLMLGFFALSFSAGLSIYFVVSNLMGIVQYAAMGKTDWGALIGRPRKALATDTVVSVGRRSEPQEASTTMTDRPERPASKAKPVPPRAKPKRRGAR
ncbi:MAG: YidC/Oxa1 family membrane protein insertase [Burkholderiales bacterium]|nr:YidC/Oxa1 family membrane protein insertase [Anaerolineae bacterium]